ncbi:MAG: cytochrome C peroxidase [Saprospiraceae bacterium]|nr:cytochrome C peroxidase [Saprospiraceae bacterium]
MRFSIGFAFLFLLLLSCEDPADNSDDLSNIPYTPSDHYPITYPDSFPVPSDDISNPRTKAGVQLGRHLFYDPILSLDSSISCSSCHNPKLAFTDGKAFSPGVGGTLGNRSSMSLLNIVYFTNGLFWDGRSPNLIDQAKQPVENPVEMHENWGNVEQKLRRSTFYPELFRAAFGINKKSEIRKELAAKAIAQWESILIAGGNSHYYKVIRRKSAFTPDQADGFTMYFNLDPRFPDAQCGHCHTGRLFASSNYFNNGLDSVGNVYEFKDPGRGAVSMAPLDYGRFKAPSLINIQLSAPYMHDGRINTLEEVMEHYTKHVKPAPNIDPNVANLKLTDDQSRQILAFINTLIDTSYYKNPDFFSPF